MDRDVLLAADRVADRWCAHRRADIEVPQRLQLFVVEGSESSVDRAGEYEAPGGCQHTGVVRIVELGRRLYFAGCHIDCRDLTPHPLVARRNTAIPERPAHAGLVYLQLGAAVDPGAIGQVLRWIPCGGKEVHPTLDIRADIDLAVRPVAHYSILLHLLGRIVFNRLAGLRIDALC